MQEENSDLKWQFHAKLCICQGRKKKLHEETDRRIGRIVSQYQEYKHNNLADYIQTLRQLQQIFFK